MRVLDMHCDTLTRCKGQGWNLDDPRAQLRLDDAAGFESYIQLYAVFIPDEVRGRKAGDYFSVHHAFYRRQLEALGERIRDAGTAKTLLEARERRGMSSILAIEGGSVLAGDLAMVDYIANAGVRSLTLTWNGNNEIAGGEGEGGPLTDFGRAAIRALEERQIAVDVSHLCDESFWDVIDFAEKPVIATHSNARAVCGHRRNLTDEMFHAIASHGGVVGINYSVYFLRDGGKDVGFEDFVRHISHFIDLGGEDAIALGSDYDGTDVPDCVGRPASLPKLYEALVDAGIPRSIADKLFFENAYHYFERLMRGAF